ncbi:cation acetate symporter [Porticoccaceae bacterium]|nr:cation acetate symporter [Porticoccaceae bacterium]
MSIPILVFISLVLITLAITYWASRRSVDRSGIYTAGGNITAWQNGLAVTGDFVSAAAILGSVALFFFAAVDTAIFYISPLVGLCLLLILIATPLRELGKYTVGDVLASQLPGSAIRIFSAVSTLILSQLYVIAQLVGAGNLFSIVFDLDYEVAVFFVGALIIIYVGFGGMLATTWVQIVKAALLIMGVVLLSALSVYQAGSLSNLFSQAEQAYGSDLGIFGRSGMTPFSSLSLAAALVFGMLGMPHLLIRFLTVPDAATARRSVVISALLIAIVLGLLILVVGPATLAFVKDDLTYYNSSGDIIGGSNMILLHLSKYLGGELLFGMIAALTFSTILAVVAGLTVAMASSAARDIYFALRGEMGQETERMEILIFRMTAVFAVIVACFISIALQKQNIAYLSALAFGIAAATNFPILILTIYWRRLTTLGALSGGLTGLLTALIMLVIGPTVWVQLLGNANPIFPSDYSTLISAPIAFLVSYIVSLMDTKGWGEKLDLLDATNNGSVVP